MARDSGYDSQRGVAFSTYAWPCIMRQVWQAVKGADRTTPQPVMAPASPIIWEQDPAVVWEVSVVHSALHDLVGRLPARLRYIIIARYGLAGDPAATYREIRRPLLSLSLHQPATGLQHEGCFLQRFDRIKLVVEHLWR